MELGFCVATGAFEYARYFSVVKTLNIVKEKDAAIPRRHGGQGSIDVEAVDYPGLRQITKAETASGALVWDIFHQEIEGHNRKCALAQVHQNSVDGESMEPRRKGGVAAKQ